MRRRGRSGPTGRSRADQREVGEERPRAARCVEVELVVVALDALVALEAPVVVHAELQAAGPAHLEVEAVVTGVRGDEPAGDDGATDSAASCPLITAPRFCSTRCASSMPEALPPSLPLLSWLATSGMFYLMTVAGQKVLLTMRTQILERIQSLSLKFFDEREAGDLMSRLVNDTQVVNDVFSQSIVRLLSIRSPGIRWAFGVCRWFAGRFRLRCAAIARRPGDRGIRRLGRSRLGFGWRGFGWVGFG